MRWRQNKCFNQKRAKDKGHFAASNLFHDLICEVGLF
uniref:Uncharacterized protein n=1 Tax=Arundo donax TaxID=35708 RepID=A0A0A9FKA4_ARUDO